MEVKTYTDLDIRILHRLFIFKAEIEGMVAENLQREHIGESMAYTEVQFQQRIVQLDEDMDKLRMEDNEPVGEKGFDDTGTHI